MRGVIVLCSLIAVLPAASQPVIFPGGAVNAASYAITSEPNSAIAQGSLFVVFGSNLGPASPAQSGFPLSTSLAGTSAAVTVNEITTSPLLIYTAASQVVMLMPSSTPAGSGVIRIAYNGQTSAPVSLRVSDASFGIFTANQAGSGPGAITDANNRVVALTHAANPGQTVTLWGTGLGKIAADETRPPPAGNVGPEPAVWVGSQRAKVFYWGRSPCCGGLDQINFEVPAGLEGCFIPVAVQAGSSVSNYASMAVAGHGDICSDPGGLTAAQLSLAQTGHDLDVATLSLTRSIATVSTPSGTGPTITTTDSGSASFLRYTPAQLNTSTFGHAVSPGACMVFPLYGSTSFSDPVQPGGLDAGPVVEVGGTNGTVEITQSAAMKGYYAATFGSSPTSPLFLDVPAHTLNVYGGPDIGVFAQEVRMPTTLTWVNQGSISSVSESQGITVIWSGAPPAGYVTVTGYSLSPGPNGDIGSGAGFYCTAQSGANGAGQLTVSPVVLANLPLSQAASSTPTGYLAISSRLSPSDPLGPVRGIDAAFIYTSLQLAKNVNYVR